MQFKHYSWLLVRVKFWFILLLLLCRISKVKKGYNPVRFQDLFCALQSPVTARRPVPKIWWNSISGVASIRSSPLILKTHNESIAFFLAMVGHFVARWMGVSSSQNLPSRCQRIPFSCQVIYRLCRCNWFSLKSKYYFRLWKEVQ